MKRATASATPAPGRLVDIGGRRLHLVERGTGSPTVVIETGAGALALGWDAVAEELASSVRVVTYDRAGYGWSDTGAATQTGETVAEDLHALLAHAGIAPPYVLVGHSLGGLYIRSFAARYPDDVAGLVLVDSTHEQMLEQIRAELGDVAVAKALGMSAAMTAAPRGAARVAVRTPAGRKAARALMGGETDDELDLRIALYLRSSLRRAQVAEMRGMRPTMRALEDAQLPDGMPLAVVTAAEPAADDTSILAQIRPLWCKLQDDLATRSSRSLHLTAKRGGHFVQNDDPETVLEAIRWVLDASI